MDITTVMLKNGLPKVISGTTRVLILGSLPGDESIWKQQYYASSSNDFWRLISCTIGEDISKLDYGSRIGKLVENGIGLWDVFRRCERLGSLDWDIRNQEINDFSNLGYIAPNLRLICFNGKTAGKSAQFFCDKGYRTMVLLSSSGANRRYSVKRESQWKSVLKIA